MKAFPSDNKELNYQNYGMDLRDYFASKAMEALIIKVDFVKTDLIEILPEKAYEWADAMMKARNK